MKKAPLLRAPTPQLKKQFEDFIGPPTTVDLEDRHRKQKSWNAAIFAASILAVILAGIALGFSIWNYGEINHYSVPTVLYTSGVLNYSPYGIYLAGTGAPQTMTLPNDLSPYVGKIYRVWSLSNQPHQVQISGVGSTFTGGGVTATFLGGIGDGFVFEVISKNFISVISSTNVNFI